MNEPRVLNVSDLPPFSVSNDAPVWWGQVAIVAIEATMFGILIATYFYVRIGMDVWPPPGDRLPALTLPSISLALLLISALGSYWASEAAKRNDRAGMIRGMAFNIVLALAAFALRVVEWRSLGFNWQADINGTLVWSFLGLHSFDYLADLVFTIVLLVAVLIGRCGPKQRIGVHVDSVVWYFIAAVWVPIYIVIYWGPRFVGTR